MVDWKGGCMPLVYVHCAICETYLMQWYSIDLWPIGGEGGGTSGQGIHAFSNM